MNEQENDVSWALKLLEREPEYEENIVARWISPFYMGALAFCTPLAHNAVHSRPVWAGIHRHFIWGFFGALVGLGIRERSMYLAADRDAKMRDYIIRHPEDFPPPVRVKYADVFDEWCPIR